MVPSGEQKPRVYLVLGTAGSGRRALLADLIEDGLPEEDRPAVLIAATEAEAGLGVDVPRAVVGTWTWVGEGIIGADVPDAATHVFFLTDGRGNLIDQIEAFKLWMSAQGLELARVLGVVDCRLAEANPPLLAWFDACVHFSDVILLNHREGVANKWMSDFQARYREQHFPCLFEFVRDHRVRNPALILEPQALRISHVFDDEIDWTVVGEDGSDDETDAPDGEEEVEVAPEVDPYFERLNGGRRVKELPDLARYLTSPPPPRPQTPSPSP